MIPNDTRWFLTESESRAVRKVFRNIIERNGNGRGHYDILTQSLQEVGGILEDELAHAFPEDTIPTRQHIVGYLARTRGCVPRMKSRLGMLFCWHRKLEGFQYRPELGQGAWGWRCDKCGKHA